MITMTGKIRLISNDRGVLQSVLTNVSRNNLSADIHTILGARKQTANPFVIGSSQLGSNNSLVGGIDYFMSSELSNENGVFENPISFTISGSGITAFTIEFDNSNNRYPKHLTVNGVTYENDDPYFTITTTKTDALVVTIEDWNKPLSPIVISGIYITIDIDLNRRNLIDLETTIFDRGDYSLPSYGIVSNTGNLTFNDTNGEIRDYAEELLLASDLKVEITLTDTLTKKSEQIAVMETKEWDYDNDSKVVSVSLQDDLVEWQDIQVEGLNYDPRNPFATLRNRNMAELYVWLCGKTPSKYNMVKFENLNTQTQTVLTNTIVYYPLLKKNTLWEQWTKLCQVCALYIYKDKDKTLCNYTYGS